MRLVVKIVRNNKSRKSSIASYQKVYVGVGDGNLTLIEVEKYLDLFNRQGMFKAFKEGEIVRLNGVKGKYVSSICTPLASGTATTSLCPKTGSNSQSQAIPSMLRV